MSICRSTARADSSFSSTVRNSVHSPRRSDPSSQEPWRPSIRATASFTSLPSTIAERECGASALVEIERGLLIDRDGEFHLALLLLAGLAHVDDEVAGRHAKQRQRRLQLDSLKLELTRHL